MIRRPPRSTRVRSSAASDVYKRQWPCRSRCQQAPGAAWTGSGWPAALARAGRTLGDEVKPCQQVLVHSRAFRCELHSLLGAVVLQDESLFFEGLDQLGILVHLGKCVGQGLDDAVWCVLGHGNSAVCTVDQVVSLFGEGRHVWQACLLYTSPSPRDRTRSRMP